MTVSLFGDGKDQLASKMVLCLQEREGGLPKEERSLPAEEELGDHSDRGIRAHLDSCL